MRNNLADPDLSPRISLANACNNRWMKQPPVRLRGLSSVMEAEHDGEGAGGQNLLVVVVVGVVKEAVRCC